MIRLFAAIAAIVALAVSADGAPVKVVAKQKVVAAKVVNRTVVVNRGLFRPLFRPFLGFGLGFGRLGFGFGLSNAELLGLSTVRLSSGSDIVFVGGRPGVLDRFGRFVPPN